MKILSFAVALVAGKPNAKSAKASANLEDICGVSVTVGEGREVNTNPLVLLRFKYLNEGFQQQTEKTDP